MSKKDDNVLERTMMPAFYEIDRDGKLRFESSTKVLQDPSLAAQVLDQAISELRDWFGKYYALYLARPELRPSLAPVIRAIEEVVP